VDEGAARPNGGPPSPRVPSGALTALLADLARAPDVPAGGGWAGVLRSGARVGRFELIREIGRGGFGVVWEARDVDLGRSVAFKAVQAGGQAGLREERLLREAEAAARLSHPNIVTLHDVGRAEAGPYLVLELLRGQTLEARLAEGALAVPEVLRIALQIAEGVAHAHHGGVVHRDLKPANVFLCDDGRVKVLDFGMAHAFGQRRVEGGTPAYMAPEQWEGAPEDERTDVFAFGVMLFKMLAGELPFAEGPPAQAAPVLDVPGSTPLAGLVAAMLQLRPVERPRDGGVVVEALAEIRRALDRDGPTTGQARARRWPRLRLAAVAGAAALAGAIIAFAVVQQRRSPTAGDGRVVVAVADFVNDTRDPELDGLSGLLITAMEQSQRLTVLTRTRMLDLARQAGHREVTRIDEVLGREVGRKAGARALLVAAVHKLGDLYAVELRATDPVKDEYLFTVREQAASKEAIFALLDRVSDRARSELREGSAEVRSAQVKVAEATTGSFEAYQHYFRGDQLKEAIRYEQAVEAYRKAIAIDPGFALAHYRIAYLGEFLHMDPGAQRAEMEAALRHVDRVPAKERLLFQAWKAHLDGRNDEAHALYARTLEGYPEDKETLFMAGDLYLHQKRYAEALPYFERAVALDPYWEPAMMHVVDSLFGLGRKDELMRRSREWADKAPGGQAFRALSLAYGASGKPEQALAASRRAYEIEGTPFARANLWEALLLDERYPEAEALARVSLQHSASKLDALYATPMLITAVAYQGRRREALRLLDEAPADMGGKPWLREATRLELLMGDGATAPALRVARALGSRSGEPLKMLPMILAVLGDAAGAAELARQLPAGPELDLYQATATWKRGEADRAAILLKEIARRPAEYESRGPAALLLAQIAMERGRWAEAITATEDLRLAGGGTWRSWAWPQALYLSALAHQQLGQRAAAIERLDHLLLIWKKADPDLPLLRDARALRERLRER
jgi:tetratricopeptide (TPR) repeat protein